MENVPAHTIGTAQEHLEARRSCRVSRQRADIIAAWQEV
jgi:hypothetical protein